MLDGQVVADTGRDRGVLVAPRAANAAVGRTRLRTRINATVARSVRPARPKSWLCVLDTNDVDAAFPMFHESDISYARATQRLAGGAPIETRAGAPASGNARNELELRRCGSAGPGDDDRTVFSTRG